ncbi:MAG: hypothetical protein KUF75_05860 [Candidatus Thiodiazotropha sp. (ex Ctena orbiculata)]|nr:hypothetical protein [Candidatus Thiodiazotropha taylori]
MLASVSTFDSSFFETFDPISERLSGLEASISSFHADFDYSMSLLIDRMEILQESFKDIISKLDEIHETLKHPLLTKAAELRNIGFDRLSKGLLDKALDAFLESSSVYDTDFIVQLQIGKLYLYGIDKESDLIDLDKSKKYLLNSARYAMAEATIVKDDKEKQFLLSKAAEANYHASIAFYVQSGNVDSKYAGKLLERALELSSEAAKQNPLLSQAQYHRAKYAALLNKADDIYEGLHAALELDEKYELSVLVDKDFNGQREIIKKILNEKKKIALKDFLRKRKRLNELIVKMRHDYNMDLKLALLAEEQAESYELSESSSFCAIKKGLDALPRSLFENIKKEISKQNDINNSIKSYKLKEQREKRKTLIIVILLVCITFAVFHSYDLMHLGAGLFKDNEHLSIKKKRDNSSSVLIHNPNAKPSIRHMLKFLGTWKGNIKTSIRRVKEYPLILTIRVSDNIYTVVTDYPSLNFTGKLQLIDSSINQLTFEEKLTSEGKTYNSGIITLIIDDKKMLHWTRYTVQGPRQDRGMLVKQ